LPLPPHIPRCQYVRTNGVQCGSPSLRNRAFCYYHFKASSPAPVTCEITPVETADGIQVAIGNILQALEMDKIDTKKAIAMLYGLQIASTNLKRTNSQPNWEEVVTELGSQEQEEWHKKIAIEQAQDIQSAAIKAHLEDARKERLAIETMKRDPDEGRALLRMSRRERRELDRKVYETTGNTAALADMDEEDAKREHA
jgi:hypothetical protein